MKQTLTYILALSALVFFSCRKDSFITSPDARVSIGVDSLHFDTVFTTAGSVTHFFKSSAPLLVCRAGLYTSKYLNN